MVFLKKRKEIQLVIWGRDSFINPWSLFLAFTAPKIHLTTPGCNCHHFSQQPLHFYSSNFYCSMLFPVTVCVSKNYLYGTISIVFVILYFSSSFVFFTWMDACSRWQFVHFSAFFFHFHWCSSKWQFCASKKYSKCGSTFIFFFLFFFFFFFSSFSILIDFSSSMQRLVK